MAGTRAPAKRGKWSRGTSAESEEGTAAEKHAAMTWAKTRKRVLLRTSCPFGLRASLQLFQIAPGDVVDIDVQSCEACGGAAKIIAAVDDPVAIRKNLDRLEG